MNKYSMFIRLLTVKNNSDVDMRTSHAQLLEKGHQHGGEDSKNKSLLKETFCPKGGNI